MQERLKYQIALTLIPQIGDILAKRLVAYCGSPEAVFDEKTAVLAKIPGVGIHPVNAMHRLKSNLFKQAEEEIAFIEKNGITPLFYLNKNYPKRLLHCEDGPVMLYFKGNADLNATKIVNIVGTRTPTEYGKKMCEKLVADLAIYNITIVSGLAYGIDICAHKSAMDQKLPTVCVLAHGLDRIYPSEHSATADKMLKAGGWLTDFMSGTKPDKGNFPSRNRIVAGIADATIVVESKKKGGSLITADIANSYNRDVFAFPGRADDESSVGCNNLIKQNKAALIQSAADIIYIMGWEEVKTKKATIQKQLFVDLKPEEEVLVNVLKEKEQMNIDDLCLTSKMPVSKVSTLLLSLEFSGIIKSLPGKIYRLN